MRAESGTAGRTSSGLTGRAGVDSVEIARRRATGSVLQNSSMLATGTTWPGPTSTPTIADLPSRYPMIRIASCLSSGLRASVAVPLSTAGQRRPGGRVGIGGRRVIERYEPSVLNGPTDIDPVTDLDLGRVGD